MNIRAEAGFGKSYMIEKLIEKYGEDGVLRIAPTNVAAVRIGGKTIHGVLHIPFNNPSGYVGEKILKSIEENKNLKVICLDEQGIVGGELFNLLYQLKKRIKISFFSFGDFYQLGPVKDNNIYIDNEIVKNICDNNVCVLEYHDRCRHSPEMYKICQKIREGEKDLSMFKTITWNDLNKFDIHICFTNIMVRKVNERCAELMCEESEAKGEKRIVSFGDLDNFNKHYTKICVGMPILGIHNNHEKEYYNGERFRILDIGISKIISDDADEQTQYENILIKIKSEVKEDKEIIINLYEYFKNFELAFAMTNHKIIGSTIASNFVVHEIDFCYSDDRWLYTAISRGKESDQIFLLPSSALPRECPQSS